MGKPAVLKTQRDEGYQARHLQMKYCDSKHRCPLQVRNVCVVHKLHRGSMVEVTILNQCVLEWTSVLCLEKC